MSLQAMKALLEYFEAGEPEEFTLEIGKAAPLVLELPATHQYVVVCEDTNCDSDDQWQNFLEKHFGLGKLEVEGTKIEWDTDNGYGGAVLLEGNIVDIWVAGCEGASAYSILIVPVETWESFK